ncbi:putative holin-like toxin [Paucilactobacillus hokkaidonensis]
MFHPLKGVSTTVFQSISLMLTFGLLVVAIVNIKK